jgi:hypothetical protein
MIWRWMAVAAAVVLLLPSAASAKQVTKVLVVGANGRSVNLGQGWPLYQRFRPPNAAPVAAPSGSYLLLFPLMENGLPMEPARYYPASQTACWSWSLAGGHCFAVPRVPATWSHTVVLTSFSLEPTTLAGLSHQGAPYTVPSNGTVAIELALLRTRLAVRAPRSPCLWRLNAQWQDAASAARPTSLCLRARGVSTGGRLYPLSRAVAAILHSVS